MAVYEISRNEIHSAWATATYRIEAATEEEALIKLTRRKADGTDTHSFTFDEFTDGEASYVDDDGVDIELIKELP